MGLGYSSLESRRPELVPRSLLPTCRPVPSVPESAQGQHKVLTPLFVVSFSHNRKKISLTSALSTPPISRETSPPLAGLNRWKQDGHDGPRKRFWPLFVHWRHQPCREVETSPPFVEFAVLIMARVGKHVPRQLLLLNDRHTPRPPPLPSLSACFDAYLPVAKSEDTPRRS